MQDSLHEIVDMMYSPDDEVRARGIERMAIEGGGKAVPYLIEAMKDESLRLRNMAKTALTQADLDGLLPYLDLALRDGEDADRRNAAIDVYTTLGKKVVPALGSLVTDPDEEIRNFACVILGNIKDPSTVPMIMKSLGDEVSIVSHAAAEALGKIGDARAVGALIDILDTDDFWLAFPAISALGEIGDERAVVPLIKFLDNDLLSLSAVTALGRIGSPAALTHLVGLLDSEEPSLRAEALQAVVAIQLRMLSGNPGTGGEGISPVLADKLSGDEVKSFLVGLLSSPDTGLKRDALTALGWAREDRAVDRIIELMVEDDLTEAASDALVGIGLPALPEVKKNVNHPVGLVRLEMVRYLGSLGLDHGREILRRMLSDDMSIVRAQAALTLGRLGDEGAIDGLVNALGDENPEVQEAAISALANLDPKSVCSKLIPYLKASDPQYMYLAAETLGYLRLAEAITPLTSLLDDPHDIIREVAVKSLGSIGGQGAVTPLLTSLRDESPRVRQQAISSLGRIKDPMVRGRLEELMGSGDDATCYYAIRALKDQGAAESLPVLVGALSDERKNIVVAAIEAIGALRNPSACASLVEAASGDDRDIVRTAVESLGTIGCKEARETLLGLLGHPHWSIRSACAGSLGRIGGAGVYEALAGLLNEDDHVVIKTAIGSLGMLGDDRAVERLVPYLADETFGRDAYEALMRIGVVAERGIVSCLQDSPTPLLIKGIRLLGQLAGDESLEFLESMLMHREPAVRREAAMALAESGQDGPLPTLRKMSSEDPEEIVRSAAASAVDSLENNR